MLTLPMIQINDQEIYLTILHYKNCLFGVTKIVKICYKSKYV